MIGPWAMLARAMSQQPMVQESEDQPWAMLARAMSQQPMVQESEDRMRKGEQTVNVRATVTRTKTGKVAPRKAHRAKRKKADPHATPHQKRAHAVEAWAADQAFTLQSWQKVHRDMRAMLGLPPGPKARSVPNFDGLADDTSESTREWVDGLHRYMQGERPDWDRINKAKAKAEAKIKAEEAYQAQGVEVLEDGLRSLKSLRGKQVWLYHGTSSTFVDEILQHGLHPPRDPKGRSNVGKKGSERSDRPSVFLTGDDSDSAGSAMGYARRAAAKHGGHPVVIRVLVNGDDLTSDRDDADLSVGRWQFEVPSVAPDQVMEVDGERVDRMRKGEQTVNVRATVTRTKTGKVAPRKAHRAKRKKAAPESAPPRPVGVFDHMIVYGDEVPTPPGMLSLYRASEDAALAPGQSAGELGVALLYGSTASPLWSGPRAVRQYHVESGSELDLTGGDVDDAYDTLMAMLPDYGVQWTPDPDNETLYDVLSHDDVIAALGAKHDFVLVPEVAPEGTTTWWRVGPPVQPVAVLAQGGATREQKIAAMMQHLDGLGDAVTAEHRQRVQANPDAAAEALYEYVDDPEWSLEELLDVDASTRTYHGQFDEERIQQIMVGLGVTPFRADAGTMAKAAAMPAPAGAPPRPGLQLVVSKKNPRVRRWMQTQQKPQAPQRPPARQDEPEDKPKRAEATKTQPAKRKPASAPAAAQKAPRVDVPKRQTEQPGSGTPRRGQVYQMPMPELGDLKAFNTLPKARRAAMASRWSDVEQELDARFGTRSYDEDSVSDAMGSAGDHLRDLVADGWMAEGNLEHADAIVMALGDALERAGASPAEASHVLHDSVRKLGHQEYESMRRTLGDHGVRHLAHNVRAMNEILDAVGHDDPQERLAGVLVMVNHDLGYTIPAIARGRFSVKDNFHPAASAELWRQQVKADPVMSAVLGEAAGWMPGWIAEHSSTGVDWKHDPVGSAVRVADNTHLFGDKMPEVLFDTPGAMEAMVKIAFASQAGLKGKDLDPLRDAMRSHVSDLPEPQRSALHEAIGEVGELTPKFLASRLAGRDASFAFDSSSNTLNVDVEQSPLRRLIGRVFGPDRADQQFHKLLGDYGVPKDVQGLDVTVGGDNGKIRLRWSPPRGKPHPLEQQYLATIRQVRREWMRVQDAPEGRQRDAERRAFFGRLRKAAMGTIAAEGLGST